MLQWFKMHYQKAFKQASAKISNPNLWHISQESVARGVAVGLFVAFVPFIPFQTMMAIVLSIALRANFAIAFAVSWVSNPLTLIPLTYFTYHVGLWVLGEAHHPTLIMHDFNWDHNTRFWTAFITWIQPFGNPFLVGMPILALSSAFLGYFLVRAFWHILPFKKKQ